VVGSINFQGRDDDTLEERVYCTILLKSIGRSTRARWDLHGICHAVGSKGTCIKSKLEAESDCAIVYSGHAFHCSFICRWLRERIEYAAARARCKIPILTMALRDRRYSKASIELRRQSYHASRISYKFDVRNYLANSETRLSVESARVSISETRGRRSSEAS